MNKKIWHLDKMVLRSRLRSLVFIGLALGVSGSATLVHADQFDVKINALSNQNTVAQNSVTDLLNQAGSYQSAIAQLSAQVDQLQSQIAANQAQQASLGQQITVNEADITTKKAQLSDDITTIYVNGQETTLEELASSKDLSSYVDAEENRSLVQDQLNTKIKAITALQVQLKDQKQQIDQLLSDQRSQQTQLASQQAEQASLLAYDQSQQTALNQQIQSNNASITSLRAQQVAANRKASGSARVTAGDPNHGGYPSYLDNSSMDSLVDPWGMYNRECVSYTAWKVQQTYGHMPYWGGRGNANQWPGDARAAGIPTGTTPKANSVAIWNIGSYGHAMWVNSVNSNGTVNVSQYNYDYEGHYSEMTVSSSAMTFIYFGG